MGLKMIIEMKAHPAFQRRENDTKISAIDELQASLIKGLTTNVALVERALERFRAEPSVQSRKLLVNSRLTITQFLINIESEEENLALLGDDFLTQYAMLKARLVMIRAEMESEIDNFVETPVYQPVNPPISTGVTVVSRSDNNLYWKMAGLVFFASIALVIVL